MQHCLSLPEIASIICGHLEDEGSFKGLSALAQTSRTFSEPAQDAIWREISSLKPLIRCMPEDLWRENDDELDFDDAIQAFQRSILPTDWPRFERNAKRVRIINYLEDDEMESEDYQMLVLAAWARSLFPALRTPTGLEYVSDGAEIVSEAICRFTELETLSMPSLSRSAFRHAAALPTLKTLTLHLESEVQSFLHLPSDSPHFPALRVLKVEPLLLTDCLPIIKLIYSNLRSLEIAYQDQNNPSSDWLAVTQTIEKRFLASSLATIQIHPYKKPPSSKPPAANRISIEHIHPLFTFHNLESLKIEVFGEVNLGDVALEQMAKTWPKLKSLVLSDFTTSSEPRATLASLKAFALHCKNLEKLQFSFDARRHYSTETIPRVYNTSLKFLGVSRSPLRSATDVAAFLSDIFPRLQTIECPYRVDGGVDKIRDTWNRVLGLHKVFVAVRAQEAARFAAGIPPMA
ncbi:hypothetical protein H0H81_004203 [Sphagnurus paluster]|uniref:F-box domain-containing protein n=1 Tax=Sphagnurus paluster TaxID=117069 RepID=A0A9P7GTG4_9AGAR|nr:hypothetical protein H0H81_004203 [Sphagnurus paluster]